MNDSAPLSDAELVSLIREVFAPRPGETSLAVLADLPDDRLPDNDAWRWRRAAAGDWVRALNRVSGQTGLKAHLVLFRNAGANNADFPAQAWPVPEADVEAGTDLPVTADQLDASSSVPFPELLTRHPIFIAQTECSATAPLKLAAKKIGLRAATMPGFCPEMIPALRLDYGVIDARVQFLKRLQDRAEAAEFLFAVEGGGEHRLTLDLRFREGFASGGVLRQPGTAGNLPSGEAFVVPYEGERPGEPSRSAGELPVQLEEEIVIYTVEENVAVRCRGDGPIAESEATRLRDEPAYGNLAELGLGVLAELGVQPIGELLLDEKLGLHIAFGRSDHFGGQVGAAQFSTPAAVVHIDRVYVRSLQPRIRVASVDFLMPGGERLPLIRDDAYVVDFT